MQLCFSLKITVFCYDNIYFICCSKNTALNIFVQVLPWCKFIYSLWLWFVTTKNHSCCNAKGFVNSPRLRQYIMTMWMYFEDSSLFVSKVVNFNLMGVLLWCSECTYSKLHTFIFCSPITVHCLKACVCAAVHTFMPCAYQL